MIEFFTDMFSTEFQSLGEAYVWDGTLVTAFVVADMVLFLSMIATGAAVLLCVHKALFPPVHRMFFFLACVFFGLSAVFLLDVLAIWNGFHRLTAVCRFAVALTAFVANIFLWPFLLAFVNEPEKYTKGGDGQEVFKTKEKKLQQMQSSLGKLVEERTTRLMAVEEELEQLTSATVRRERRLKELKAEVNALHTEMGKEPVYPEADIGLQEQGV